MKNRILFISLAVVFVINVGFIGCGGEGIPEYDLNIASTVGGSVNTPGEGTFTCDEGEVVKLVATPDAGYHFVEWTGDVSDVADVEDATTTITMKEDYSITAEFAVKWYDFTISSTEGGSVNTPGEGTFTCDAGTVIDLVAEAEEGYQFVNWTGDVDTIADPNSATTTITVNDNYAITANFFQGQLISDWYDLHAIRDNTSGSYILMNDLDSTTAGYQELASDTANQGKGWQPIGTLAGSFNGQGYEIRDLFINRPDENYVGLFCWIGSVGVIEDVGVVNVDIIGSYYVGGLVGHSDGNLSNSYSTGSVTGSWRVGGLVGVNGGTVSGSYSTGSVTGGDFGTGGLVGYNVGTVSDSYSTGSVTGSCWVGGLVGANDGTVSDSYSTGSVTGSSFLVGGLVGYNGGTVSDSYSTGSVTGGDFGTGGLVGDNHGTLSDSYSTGSVIGDRQIGGLVGLNGDTVSNSYSTGSVTGELSVGGLVGLTEFSGTVSNSYSTGSVTGSNYVGGLVGSSLGTASDSFWDTETSGQATSGGGTGKTTAEMQDITTFTDAEWDIIAVAPGERNPAYIWNIVDEQTYPFLS